jgi:MazG family protein
MAIAQRGDNFGELTAIMKRLLAPDGCPWDREQTMQTLKPFLVEEAYEVLEAIDKNDVPATKMRRRHPHVFGETKVKDAEEVLANWGKLKQAEHAEKGKVRRALEGVPVDLPALLRAQRLGEKAAAVGFDWPDVKGVREKVDEELREIDEAVARGNRDEIEHEIGDLLLAVSRLSAKLDIAPEDALRTALRRFTARFEAMESQIMAQGGNLADTPLEEMDRLWNEIKRTGLTLPKK